MSEAILRRVPVVAGIAFLEHVRRLPSAFTATLRVEAENRYFRHAIVVIAAGEKVGYVAPEVARSYYERVRDAAAPLTCAGRRGRHIDHESSGVELFLDFTAIETA